MYGLASMDCVCLLEVNASESEDAPITAMPLNVGAASRVGGNFASPMSWV